MDTAPLVAYGTPLCKLAEINPPGPKPRSIVADAMLDFVPMAAVGADGRLMVSEQRPFAEVAKGYNAFRDQDVLVAKITPCFENNKIALAEVSMDYAFGSTEFHVIRAMPDRLDPSYLVHFLRQDHIRYAGERRMTGSAGQRRVPTNFFAELRIPLPTIAKQKHIAAILDQADSLRRLRQRAIDRINTLGQAIFYEMFGDPAANTFGWSVKPLANLAERFSDGPFGSNLKTAHYQPAGIRVVRLQNIGIGRFIDTDKVYIAESHHKALIKHECFPGDVLVGTLGDPNLRACVQPKHKYPHSNACNYRKTAKPCQSVTCNN